MHCLLSLVHTDVVHGAGEKSRRRQKVADFVAVDYDAGMDETLEWMNVALYLWL